MAVSYSTKLKVREKQVYLTFEKALEHKGYLSLRSIIESQYSFPRTYVIEPIRNVKIVPRIDSPSPTILSQQALIWQGSGQTCHRPRLSIITEARLVKWREAVLSQNYEEVQAH